MLVGRRQEMVRRRELRKADETVQWVKECGKRRFVYDMSA
jgi:hypothetical protein